MKMNDLVEMELEIVIDEYYFLMNGTNGNQKIRERFRNLMEKYSLIQKIKYCGLLS